MSNTGKVLADFSAWIDNSYPDTMDPELIMYRRVHKIAEEYGEVGQALGGFTGENPRKGVTHTLQDVLNELLDVAVTALGAYEHATGNNGNALDDLNARIEGVAKRVGVR